MEDRWSEEISRKRMEAAGRIGSRSLRKREAIGEGVQ